MGISSSDHFSIAMNPETGELAYLLGSVIVFYDIATNKQLYYYHSKKNCTFKCIAYSLDRKILAVGESNTKSANVHILQKNHENKFALQKTLRGHQKCVDFVLITRNQLFCYALGNLDQNSEGCRLIIWDISNEASLRIYTIKERINSFALSQDPTGCITGGVWHLKLWQFGRNEVIHSFYFDSFSFERKKRRKMQWKWPAKILPRNH